MNGGEEEGVKIFTIFLINLRCEQQTQCQENLQTVWYSQLEKVEATNCRTIPQLLPSKASRNNVIKPERLREQQFVC